MYKTLKATPSQTFPKTHPKIVKSRYQYIIIKYVLKKLSSSKNVPSTI